MLCSSLLFCPDLDSHPPFDHGRGQPAALQLLRAQQGHNAAGTLLLLLCSLVWEGRGGGGWKRGRSE